MKLGFHELGVRGLVKALSADGSTVVGHVWKENRQNAFRWTQREGLVDLGPGVAHDVSADGSVVVGESSNRACRWGRDAVLEILGGTGGSASAVSDDGSVIAGIQDLRPVRWTTQGVQRLGWLQEGHEAGGAYGISGDGRVVVGTADSYDRVTIERAFRWTEERGMVALSAGGGFPYFFSNSCATAASYDGKTIVGFVGDVGVSQRGSWNQPFRWKRGWLLGGSMRCLGYPANIVKPGQSHALAASGDGKRVVGFTSDFRKSEQAAFLWIAWRGIYDLREFLLALGWETVRPLELSSAVGISADGKVILGEGSSGPWLVVLPDLRWK